MDTTNVYAPQGSDGTTCPLDGGRGDAHEYGADPTYAASGVVERLTCRKCGHTIYAPTNSV